MSDPDAPKRPDRVVPDPHAGQSSHTPDEGMRPEADPNVAWPGQNEPDGPVPGLFQTAGAETAAHYAHSPAAAAIAEAAGVEEEGLESGQLFGLMLATGVAVIVLILTIYFLFYSPLLQETRNVAADVPLDRYVELRDSRTAGVALISDYAVNEDSTYRLPIDAAMQLVARDYAQEAAGPGPEAAPAANNGLSWLTITAPAAVRSATGGGSTAPPDTAAAATDPAPAAAPGSGSSPGQAAQ
jgi:hypothetical protein